MTDSSIYPVILSGGSGTRLWPLSRTLYPKQLLPLVGARSLLQDSALRLAGDSRFAAPLIIGNDEHRFLIAEQLRAVEITPQAIVLEPVGRNTAPAAAVAALMLLREDEKALMLIMPSDHAIARPDAFLCAINQAAVAAAAGHLVTFGIQPDAPETGYGYIQRGAALGGFKGCYALSRFVEKPDQVTAQRYLDAGDYYWNSGIFLFPAAAYLAELESYAPEMVEACRKAVDEGAMDLSFFRLDEAAFGACPANSIDYAVMEQTADGVVIPVDMGWSDVGSWSALWQIRDKDDAGTTISGDVLTLDVKNSLLHADGPMIAAVGLEDIVLVATKDVVLAVSRDHAQDVKKIVEQLKAAGRDEHFTHTEVFRPWGSFETVDQGERFKVKRIVVKPGEKLSLQKHHHRAEHWIVVKGTAKVTCGDKTLLVEENQSTYIPLGTKHRLENPGKIPLHMIEVQSGAYLGEDDIVRFDDTYGRR
jgi:mannose-1-phosphate guanylyltransferase/mannose-1-phosphate guanylyltransferase/mannose-6-phosphate isomerase